MLFCPVAHNTHVVTVAEGMAGQLHSFPQRSREDGLRKIKVVGTEVRDGDGVSKIVVFGKGRTGQAKRKG